MGKSTCGGFEAFLLEAHQKGGNYDGDYCVSRRQRALVGAELPAV